MVEGILIILGKRQKKLREELVEEENQSIILEDVMAIRVDIFIRMCRIHTGKLHMVHRVMIIITIQTNKLFWEEKSILLD